MQWGVAASNQRHALLAASDEYRIQFKRVSKGDTFPFDIGFTLATPNDSLELGKVGRNDGGTAITLEISSFRIDDHGFARSASSGNQFL